MVRAEPSFHRLHERQRASGSLHVRSLHNCFQCTLAFIDTGEAPTPSLIHLA